MVMGKDSGEWVRAVVNVWVRTVVSESGQR